MNVAVCYHHLLLGPAFLQRELKRNERPEQPRRLFKNIFRQTNSKFLRLHLHVMSR